MPGGCGKSMTEYVPSGKYDYKSIKVRCGNTSPTGYPWQCEECAKANQHVDWYREALENGERIDDDY